MKAYDVQREGLLNYLLANFRDGLRNTCLWRRWPDGAEDFTIQGQAFPVMLRSISIRDNYAGKTFELHPIKKETSMLQEQNADESDAKIPEFIVMDLDGPTNENPLRFCFHSEKEDMFLTSLDDCELNIDLVLAAPYKKHLAVAAISHSIDEDTKVSGMVRSVEREFVRYICAKVGVNYEFDD